MRLVISGLSMFLALICLSGCMDTANQSSSNPDKDKTEPVTSVLDRGNLDGLHYQHDFFGFDLTLKEGWHIQSEKDLVEVEKETSLPGEQPTSLADQQLVYLLQTFEFSPDTMVDFNPSIGIIANKLTPENGSDAEPITTAEGYLNEVRKGLSVNAMFTLSEEIGSVNIGGKTLRTMDVSFSLPETTINQQYLVFVKKDYAIQLIVSYNSEDQKNQLMQVVNSLGFS